MGNCIIASPNLIDGATLSGGSWTAGLPVANVQNRLLGKVARSTNALVGSTKFTATFPAPVRADSIALVAHNLSETALFRITATGYDSGWQAAWAPLPSSYFDWEDDRWWGGLPSADIIRLFTPTAIWMLPKLTESSTWTVEINDAGNPNGYVQIGRVFLGKRFQPVNNMSYGASIGFETGTTVEEAQSGAEYFDRRNGYRVARFTLEYLSQDEAMGSVLPLQRNAGIDGEVLFITDPDDLEWRVQNAFLGRMRSLSPIEHPYPIDRSVGFEIKEIL